MSTSTASRRRNSPAAKAKPERRLFSVDEYLRMAETGILKRGERVELIEGEIICLAAMGDRHVGCVLFLSDWFSERAHGRGVLSVQLPVRLTRRLDPEPDVVLLRPPVTRYRERGPTGEDVLLLIEVADTSLAYDRGRKLALYAREGIPEVWIVNLKQNQIEVHREPLGGRYQQTTVYERGSTVSPSAFPDLVLPVSEVL
jgi:Uma2 family endonuclease